jgi:ATP-dependent protease ClpP protease subunit
VNAGGNFAAMVEHIYIEGQIGTSYKEDGSVDVRGVELQDVISQVRKHAHAEKIICHITSPGGLVDVGRKIAQYLGSLPNIYTVAEVQCASIATEIHLSVPKERRAVAAGTSYLIHQPMFSFQRGSLLNKDELASMSSEIGRTQNEMVNTYAKATGMDKTGLELLMQQETALTPEQCVEFGFASQIVTTAAVAVALIKPKTNSSLENMKEEIAKLRLQVASLIAGKPVKAVSLDLTTVDGTAVTVVTDAEAPAVGDAVVDSAGAPVADATHDFGTIQVVTVGGVITEIIEVVAGDPEPNALDAEALAAELAELKAEREAEKAALAELQTEFTKLAKLQSTYKPKAQAVAFRKPAADAANADGVAGGYAGIKEAHKARKEARTQDK